MVKIISAPNIVLSQKAPDYIFGKDNSTLNALLKDMEVALLSASDPKGVGLAAPQIGKSIAVFITKPTDKAKITEFINPIILDAEKTPEKNDDKKVKKLEGCLSLPSIWGEVLRAPTVTLSYYDKKGKNYVKKFTGFMATIVQHETDHLNGVLFPKHVLEQKGTLYKSYKNENGEDEFDELSI